MSKQLLLHITPAANSDIESCVEFVARNPWGKPRDRGRDIWRAIAHALERPGSNRILVWRDPPGIHLRRINAAQFVVIYAWLRAKDPSAPSVVSIRAVRHRRIADVFQGVRETNCT